MVKAAVWLGTNDIAIEDIAEPKKGDEIIVQTQLVGICGSDITIKTGHHPRAKAPLVLGHEFMGTIWYVPERLAGLFSVGQRVTVNPLISCKRCEYCRRGDEHVCENLMLIGVERSPGALAGYVPIPQPERIYPLPDEVTAEQGAMVEPLAVAVHAVEVAALLGGEAVAVLGAGPIGLLVGQVAREKGAVRVLVSETEPARLKRARSLGFETIDARGDDVLERVQSLTGGKGVDVTFDAAGVPATPAQTIAMTRTKGRIIMVAIHKRPADVLLRDVAYKELTIRGSRIYAVDDFPKAIDLIRRGRVDLDPLVTHVLPAKEAPRAFDIAEKSTDACKVLIDLR